VGRRLFTDIDKPQEGPMQITSVRYRELVSLRGCEHEALDEGTLLESWPVPTFRSEIRIE